MHTALQSHLRSWDDENYTAMFILNNTKPKAVPVIIRAANDAENETRWQVIHHKNVLPFRSFNEVRSYCKKHGWELC